MKASIQEHDVQIDGLRLHYREVGSGEPVLLLHGWPTSSFLWRGVMAEMAAKNRVIALDLPGFGASDKPLSASYSFRFHGGVLDGFLGALKIEKLGLAVHDLGGPIGLHWALHHQERITRLALLNTIVYPEMSWAVILFVAACRIPGLRSFLTSAPGLRAAMRLGVHDPYRLTEAAMRAYLEPFQTVDARRALAKAGFGLHPKGFQDIARRLPSLKVPVRIVYGERDRILPDVAKTMDRVARDLPQAVTTELPDCGHFLQEERPQEIGRILSDFFGAPGQ